MQFFNPDNYPELLKKMNNLLKTSGILYITFRLYQPGKHDGRSYTREGEDSARYRIKGEEAEKALKRQVSKSLKNKKLKQTIL